MKYMIYRNKGYRFVPRDYPSTEDQSWPSIFGSPKSTDNYRKFGCIAALSGFFLVVLVKSLISR